MSILINNPVQSTLVFIIILALALILTTKKKINPKTFSVSVTQELKGLAILMIVFSHVGYFLAADNRFLFPLSIAAGVGVNLFLFLSGYGLISSALAKPLSIGQFYKRRLFKLYGPLWLVVALFLILDWLVLSQGYSFSYIFQSLLGFFPRADLFGDLNSPLWYFTWIVFYYLLFPLVFLKKQPWLSALALYLAGYLVITWNPVFLANVLHLYQVHILAFPLGVLVGGLASQYRGSQIAARFKASWQEININWLIKNIGYWLLIAIFTGLAVYTAYYSNVGAKPRIEEITSLVTCAALIILFIINKRESRLLYWFGIYSYEIYLLHWPIMSRLDIFYRWAPAWLATVLYLVFFLAVSWLFQRILSRPKPLPKP
jgi:peptidoglycan/LPS O-acetylase OafA/YrhL